ncbi:hypothetical protein [Mangrovibacterium marinum]|uniref:Uncharacterized protein n=1 Tax=Mangrovibacterium marinum TaxID=1639118 RepID=A0A2T5C2Y7_9BACT|nr:hypothetical protein [Mangrovibacterium marinum]PTN09062.1 hypothetical protein C8N47_106162 [Mangrovibacterium marinum]
MPYRRLPNTDQARMRAIEAALEKGKRIATSELAFSYLSLEKLQSIYPRLSGSIRQLNAAKQNQFDKSREYGEIFKKAKLYLSHFLQVMSFAIIREELRPEVRAFYGLDPNSQRLPALNLEKDVLEWGERIIRGEAQRCQKGGSPIYSPSIALVKVHFEAFIDAFRHQKMLQNITNRASEQMNMVRDEADKLIQEVWNEVEEKFSMLPDDAKREKATSYGITYVYRPSELKKMEAEKLQTNLF